MKRNFTLVVATLLLSVAAIQAQIPNAGFEQLNADGTVRNWGNVYLIPFWMDTLGNSFSDSIVYDNYFYASTNDAHWGNKALELRNAWDYTLGQGIAGAATADIDSVYSSWGSFETIEIQNQPFNFSFFYKFFPLGSDTASATLQLFDSSMNPLGEAVILISGTTSNYTLATAPVVFTTPGYAAYAFLNFRTASYGTTPGFGTRFLIDDVMFNYVTGVDDLETDRPDIYPNPTQDKINISFGNLPEKYSADIINSFGQLISSLQNPLQLDVSDLPAGIYLVKIYQGDKVFSKKVVIE